MYKLFKAFSHPVGSGPYSVLKLLFVQLVVSVWPWLTEWHCFANHKLPWLPWVGPTLYLLPRLFQYCRHCMCHPRSCHSVFSNYFPLQCQWPHCQSIYRTRERSVRRCLSGIQCVYSTTGRHERAGLSCQYMVAKRPSFFLVHPNDASISILSNVARMVPLPTFRSWNQGQLRNVPTLIPWLPNTFV